jgi:regulator of RNase E activity RraA
MTRNGGDIGRPAPELIAALRDVGSATASAELSRLGIRDSHIRGPLPWSTDLCIAGPALTLQFMPRREDVFPADEYEDRDKQVHRHVLQFTQPGDVVVVDAMGDMASGVFGEMMMTYFKGKGGVGAVIDGVLRDSSSIRKLGLGIWALGSSPNFHMQTGIAPFAVNVPIRCANVLVMPGDIIVADDDGATLVPIAFAEKVAAIGSKHVEWEEFSRLKLSQGGELKRYYPLSKEAEEEYAAWKAESGGA